MTSVEIFDKTNHIRDMMNLYCLEYRMDWNVLGEVSVLLLNSEHISLQIEIINDWFGLSPIKIFIWELDNTMKEYLWQEQIKQYLNSIEIDRFELIYQLF